jgi:hypothetical protein
LYLRNTTFLTRFWSDASETRGQPLQGSGRATVSAQT